MEPIRSGTTTERVVRTGILTAVLLIYSAWSFVDAYHRYPRGNLRGLVQNLHPSPDPQTVEINPNVTRATLQAIEADQPLSEVRARLGEPNEVQGKTSYYFGPGGMGKVISDGAKVGQASWRSGDHDDADLFIQKLIGCLVGFLGLLMVLQLIRVVTTRIELSEAGLKVNSQGGLRFGGSPLIPLEAMTALGSQDFKKKGWVEIEYTLSEGTDGVVSLNDYVHKAFREVVTEICGRRNFDNPLEVEGKADETAPPEGEAARCGSASQTQAAQSPPSPSDDATQEEA